MIEDSVERHENGAVVLSLSPETAKVLWDELHMLGEHWAAGAPIVRGSAEEERRLGRLFSDLAKALGIERWA